MARKAGQGKEEEESRAQQQEEGDASPPGREDVGLPGLYNCFPALAACMVFSGPVEARTKELTFKLDSDGIIRILWL
ncbi:hypothetical protein STEG23_011425, partial [Scotinomys teguina]